MVRFQPSSFRMGWADRAKGLSISVVTGPAMVIWRFTSSTPAAMCGSGRANPKPKVDVRCNARRRILKPPSTGPKTCVSRLTSCLRAPSKFVRIHYPLIPSRLAVAGHSFGAFTALASAGINFSPLGVSPTNYGDPRLVASIALSATAFRNQRRGAFDTVRIPTLHMTGTDDRGAVVDTGPEERRNAYDRIRNAPKYLVILDGGDHAVFGGVRRGSSKSTDKRHWAVIRSTTTAFLDSIVNGDASRNRVDGQSTTQHRRWRRAH